MNDITALAQREMEQREKFEAWTEESCALPWGYLKKRRTYDGFYSEHTYTSLWAAWKAASMALVEALEARDKQIAELECELHDANNLAEDRQLRIRDIENKQRLEYDECILAKTRLAFDLVEAKRKIASLDKAATEPVAWTEKCEITNMQATGLYLRGFPDNSHGRDIALYTVPPVLDSRTVTVKLPAWFVKDAIAVYDRDDIEEALAEAGIQAIEGEE